MKRPLRALAILSAFLPSFFMSINAEVTIYTTLEATPTAGASTSVDSSVPTTLMAYNNVICTPPPLPNPAPPNNFPVQLYPGGMANLSLPQIGSYVGFSIELSVSNQVCEYFP
jgi:hypothetical protein